MLFELVRVLFGSVSREHPRQVYAYVLDILRQVIEENSSSLIPHDVIELILSYLTQKTFSYNLAADLIRSCDDRLQTYVTQYFIDSLDSDSSAHCLIVELNKLSDNILLNVIPLLENELKSDNVSIRSLATKTLGEIFTEKCSVVRLYPNCWLSWLEKSNDKVVSIRITWMGFLDSLLKMFPEKNDELNKLLIHKLLDPEEKIRILAINVTANVDCLSQNTLEQVASRIRDKKPSVRQAAIRSLWNLFTSRRDNSCDWIPRKILDSYYINEIDVFLEIEKCFINISPELLVETFSLLDSNSRLAFFSIMQKQKTCSSYLLELCNTCKSTNKIKNSERQEIINCIASKISLFMSSNGKDSILKFVAANDQSLFKNIMEKKRKVFDSSNIQSEVLKRIKGSFSSAVASDIELLILRHFSILENSLEYIINIHSSVVAEASTKVYEGCRELLKV